MVSLRPTTPGTPNRWSGKGAGRFLKSEMEFLYSPGLLNLNGLSSKHRTSAKAAQPQTPNVGRTRKGTGVDCGAGLEASSGGGCGGGGVFVGGAILPCR